MVLTLVKHPEVIIPAPHLKLIDPDLFASASGIEIQSRIKNRPKDSRLLDGKLFCSHCGKPLVVRTGETGLVYECNRKRRKEVGLVVHHVDIEEAEAAVVQAIRELLDRAVYDETFSASYVAEIEKYEKELSERLGELKRCAAKSKAAYDNALSSLLIPPPPAVLEDLRAKIAGMEEAARGDQLAVDTAVRDLEQLGTEKADSRGRNSRIAEYFGQVGLTHPWRPSSKEERDVFDLLREMIKSIEISIGEDTASMNIDFVLFKVFPDANCEAVAEITRTVTVEDSALLLKKNARVREARAAKEAFFASDKRITDDEFATLPPFKAGCGEGEQLRLFIDIILVTEGSDIAPTTLLWAFDQDQHRHRFELLRVQYGLPHLLAHLRKTRGPSFSLTLPPGRDRHAMRNTFLNARDPILLLEICDPNSGKTTLDARQRSVIAEVCDTSHEMRFPKVVDALTAYFALIRQGLPIRRAQVIGMATHDITKLQRQRREMALVTRKLLELEGYYLPETYARPPASAYSSAKIEDPERILEEMKAGVHRGPAPEQAEPTIIAGEGVAINLTTGEIDVTDGVVFKPSLNHKLILLCILRNPGRVVSTGAIHAAMIPWGAKPNYPRQSTVKMLSWLRNTCPILASKIKNVYGEGYVYEP